MSPYEYFAKILENLPSFLLIVLLLAYPYWKLVRSIAVSVFDPIFVMIFADWMGSSLVGFMWLQSDISDNNFYYYCCSQFALILGMLAFKGRRPAAVLPSAVAVRRSTKLPFLILVNAAAIHFISTVLTWWLVGIPIFMVSRLGAFAGSGGFGVIERLQVGSALIAMFSACYVLGEAQQQFRKRFVILYFVWLLVTLFLSGSKGALLGVIQAAFVYIVIFKRDKISGQVFWGGRQGRRALAVAIVFVFLVIGVQQDVDMVGAIYAFVFRLVCYGDIYMYAYLNDTMSQVQGDNPLIGMFGGILSTFRLLPIEMIYNNMGLQLTSFVFPDIDYFAGPNPRHNVFGYHFFGWFGLVYSFMVGAVLVVLQRKLYLLENPSFIRVLIAFLLYFSLLSVMADFDYAMSSLASVSITGMVVMLLSLTVLQMSHAREQPKN